MPVPPGPATITVQRHSPVKPFGKMAEVRAPAGTRFRLHGAGRYSPQAHGSRWIADWRNSQVGRFSRATYSPQARGSRAGAREVAGG